MQFEIELDRVEDKKWLEHPDCPPEFHQWGDAKDQYVLRDVEIDLYFDPPGGDGWNEPEYCGSAEIGGPPDEIYSLNGARKLAPSEVLWFERVMSEVKDVRESIASYMESYAIDMEQQYYEDRW